MNKVMKSIVSLSIPAIVVALSMPALAVAAPPSGRVAIMNAHSGLCLSPAGGGRDNNTQIVQFTCDQDPSRFWSFTVVNGNIVEITNLNSGLCLTIAGVPTIAVERADFGASSAPWASLHVSSFFHMYPAYRLICGWSPRTHSTFFLASSSVSAMLSRSW